MMWTVTSYGDAAWKARTPPTEWLADGLLARREISSVYGPPGSGKSLLAADLGFHIARGTPEWHGRKLRRAGVAYAALERAALVRRRFDFLVSTYGPIVPGDNYIPLAVMEGPLDLSDLGSVNRFAMQIDAMGKDGSLKDGEGRIMDPQLVIIDTLSRAFGGGDENSSVDMAKVVSHMQYIESLITEWPIHWMLIHHTPDANARKLRGHGALLGALDRTICIEKFGRAGEGRLVSITKANDGPEGEVVALKIEGVDTPAGSMPAFREMSTLEAATEKGNRNEQRVSRYKVAAIEALKTLAKTTTDPIPLAEWRAMFSARVKGGTDASKRKAFYRSKKDLLASGEVEEDDRGVWLGTSGTDATNVPN